MVIVNGSLSDQNVTFWSFFVGMRECVSAVL